MKSDIEPSDLTPILEQFYDILTADPLLAEYFTDLDMSRHMPRIAAFWSTILFGTGEYHGNAFAPHMQMPGLTAERFERWVATLERVLDERFAGEKTERMKTAAHRIAYSMQLRLGIQPFAPYIPGTSQPPGGPPPGDG